MGHERIRHARNWEKRLQERNREHRSLAQIPVMIYRENRGSEESQKWEMEKLGREMYLCGDEYADMDLQQVMEFIESIDDLTTSTFYNDLAVISNRDQVRGLPAGIRSAMVKPGSKRLFVLLRSGRSRLDTVVADSQGRPLDEFRHRDDIMRAIRCFEQTPKAPPEVYPTPDDFDAWIENTRRNWAAQRDLDPNELQVVCALALIP